jgi:quercetin dioxygenase-like cupin family protein
MLQAAKPIEELAGHNVIKLEPNEGSKLWIGEWFLSWRAEGENTGYAFSIFETTITPGNGLPLHKHPFAEFFYVLEGTLDFGRWSNSGVAEWVTCGAGASVLAPPNAPHTFQNRGDQPARILSVSNYHHERMLKEAVHPQGEQNHLPARLSPEDFDRLFKSMEQDQVYVVANRA